MNLSDFITGFLFRWLLKIIGGYFAIHGLTMSGDVSDAIRQFAAGLVAIVIGIAVSAFQHYKALHTPPPTARDTLE